MKKKTIDLYEVSDLKLPENKKLLQKVLSKYREYFVIDNWYEFTTDELFDYLNLIGFENIDIRFSGFYSQGDGASFTGTLKRDYLEKYPRIGYESKLLEACDIFYKKLLDVPKGFYIYIEKIKSVPYCFYLHEHTTEIVIENEYGDYINDKSLIDCLTEDYRNLCRTYYKQLEKEYDTLISDEYILEIFEDENAVFTELGNLTNLD